MSAHDHTNRLRRRAILIAREFKWVFMAVPAWFTARPPKGLRRRLFRWLFLGEGGRLHRAGEVVLADLRGFCFADRSTIFDADPIVMARREGRREVFVRITNYLNLDEAAVQKIMELDDGY